MPELETEIRIGELERQNGRLKKWLACVTAWLVISWMFAGQRASSEPAATATAPAANKGELHARRLVIENGQGRGVIVLEGNDDGASLALTGDRTELRLEANNNFAAVTATSGKSTSGFSDSSVRLVAGLGSAAALMKGGPHLAVLRTEPSNPNLLLIDGNRHQVTTINGEKVVAGHSTTSPAKSPEELFGPDQ